MWYLQLGKLYMFLFGIPVFPFKRVQLPPRVMTLYTRFCVSGITVSSVVGLYFLSTEMSSLDSFWTTVQFWSFPMYLFAKCVGPLVLLIKANSISSTYAMTNALRTYLSSTARNTYGWKFNSLVVTITGIIVISNITDVWINSMPMAKIKFHVKAMGLQELIPLCVMVSLPTVWIYYALRYNFFVMVLEDLFCHSTIFKQILTYEPEVPTRTILPDVEERIIVSTISRCHTIHLDGKSRSSSSFGSRQFENCRRMSRALYRLSTIHYSFNAIYGDLCLWLFICSSTEYPIYLVYFAFGDNCIFLESFSTAAMFLYVALSIEHIVTFFLIMLFSYKRYSSKRAITRQVYLLTDSKVRKELRNVVSLMNEKFVDSWPVMHGVDSTIMELVSSFAFLLVTTFFVPKK